MGITFNADEVFEMGMDIEKNGEAYYKKAAELAKDPKVKKVFEYLAKEEKSHWEIFKKLRDTLGGDSATPTVMDPEGVNNLYLEALVKSRLFSNEKEAEQVAEKAADAIDALNAALIFEKDTILFFSTMKSMTRADLGSEKINLLIAEEQKHIIRISEEIKKLS
ncbi:MAG: ferritin family protein [Candidatus Krumholzibacteriota bacterium]|nr:ferritin family protein [Candidatus Krumholzibacteriota bacterium]